MTHLPFPFEESAWMMICNARQVPRMIDVEIARSRIEVYQGLQYRNAAEFNKPLVALFEDEHQEYPTLSHNAFDVEFIAVKLNFLVQEMRTILAYSGSGECYRQKFSCFSCVVMAPAGFIQQFGIDPNASRIMVFSEAEKVEQPRFISDPFKMN